MRDGAASRTRTPKTTTGGGKMPKDDVTRTEYQDQIKAFDFCISAIYQGEWGGDAYYVDTIVEGLKDGRNEAYRLMEVAHDA